MIQVLIAIIAAVCLLLVRRRDRSNHVSCVFVQYNNSSSTSSIFLAAPPAHSVLCGDSARVAPVDRGNGMVVNSTLIVAVREGSFLPSVPGIRVRHPPPQAVAAIKSGHAGGSCIR